MYRRTRAIAVASLLAVAGLLAGCQLPSSAPPTPPPAPLTVDDDALGPCAEQLHDMCGQLQLYYAAHKELPKSLTDLGGAANAGGKIPACPKSGLPYVYNPAGLEVTGWTSRLIVYDAQPSHGGMRWGILADQPRPGKPRVFYASRLPEKAIIFESAPPTP